MRARKVVFNELRLERGRIESRERCDTGALMPEALTLCRQILAVLRTGKLRVPEPIPTLPGYWIMLGPPVWLADAVGEAGSQFFCVGVGDASEEQPLQVNLILAAAEVSSEDDDQALSAMLGLSTLSGGREELSKHLAERVKAVVDLRPVLVTVLLPAEDMEEDTLLAISDFSRVLAAAMLLEE